MSDLEANSLGVIPEDLMLARLAQSEQLREFFVEMWIQNPALARQGGETVRSLLVSGSQATIMPGG